jgi:peptidoglycan hydrolase-like protein with peptidoglycan-binding domain
MRINAIAGGRIAALAGGALLAATMVVPAQAQTTPPLAYVQPLPQASVQAVQDRLRNAGSYTGQADGMWGPDSALALQRFQQTHQLQVTGQMNQATAATLGIDPGTLMASAQPVAATSAVAPPVMAPSVPPNDQLRPASVRAVQARLGSLGFYRGNVDGVWGQSTQSAIQSFQQGRGLQPNGQLNPATVSAMGLAPDAVAYR